MSDLDVEVIRRQFPALDRQVDGRPAVYLDGPAGSQVPERVAEAVSSYLLHTNANHGGRFATSRESDDLFDRACSGLADFVGARDPGTIVFGANMTSLTFPLARALCATWGEGDEVVVCHTEHDANFTPWTIAAARAGATVREVGIHREDATLDVEALESMLGPRTRLVAVGCAGNALGTVNPVEEIIARVRERTEALVFLDAVHYAPHRRLAVEQWGCDFLACSAYKFFGPHVGVLWGRRELLESLPVDKLRPPPDAIPDRWMTGTANYECIAGALEAVEYLADLGREVAVDGSLGRSAALDEAYAAIAVHERALLRRLLEGLSTLGSYRVWGITDIDRLDERVATVSITHASRTPAELARLLGERGIFVWDGNFYALPLTEELGLEPEGAVRIGLLHYSTEQEVDRLLNALSEIG